MAETALFAPSAVSPAPAVRLASLWLSALNVTADETAAEPDEIPMDVASARRFLTDQSAALVDILLGDPFRPRRAAAVGHALVKADFVSADVLGRSLRVLVLRLPALLSGALSGARNVMGAAAAARAAAELDRRVAEVTEALANGYVRALRDRTLAEQESIRRAQLDAHRIISERLEHEATHDPLTGLPNRAAVLGRLATALGDGQEPERQQPERQCAASQESDGQEPERQEPGSQEPGSQEPGSQDRDGQEPECQDAGGQHPGGRDPGGQHPGGQHPGGQDPDGWVLDGQGADRQGADGLDPDRRCPGRREPGAEDCLVGLCYVDLDGFKVVNDRYGHEVGDELLVTVARRIAEVSRARGALAGRIGGDEFVVVAERSPGRAGLTALASEILAVVSRPVPLRVGRVSVSACAGIAECAPGSPGARTVVADADAALYRAKSRGPGCWEVHD